MSPGNDRARPPTRKRAHLSNTNDATMVRRVLGRWKLTHWPSPDPDRCGRVLVAGRDAGRVLMSLGFHPVWNGMRRGWALDDEHLPDVAAIASMKTLGYRLVHLDGGDCLCAVAPRERRRHDVDPSEESCTCGDLDPLPQVVLEMLGAEEIEHWHRGVA